MISEIGDQQETDVAIVREYWYQLENGEIEDGGSSNYAPTYHPLYVTAEQASVTFHNYASIHDERIESTVYYVIWSIVVYEILDGDLELEKYVETGKYTYSPPVDISDIQSISIDVDVNGVEIHTYRVCSGFEWYKVKSDDSLDFIEHTEYGKDAVVFEVQDLPVVGTKSTL